jgi:hypothetical protein
MTGKQAEPIAELIKSPRVKPGSKVRLAKDFDPAWRRTKTSSATSPPGRTELADSPSAG